MAKVIKKKCLGCAKSKSMAEYYNSRSSFSSDGKTDFCKSCLTKNLDYNNVETVLDILRIMDIPFIEETYLKVLEKYPNTALGNYLRQLNGMRQLIDKHYSDSIFKDDKPKTNIKSTSVEEEIKSEEILEYENFWGEGYKLKDYQLFQKKYNLLADDYGANKSSMHQEALQTYCILKSKQEMALISGNIKEAKEYGTLATKAAEGAKITPKQLTAKDLQDGLTTFSQLSLLVEENKDAISILPKMRETPQDKADFILFCYINYIRKLKGLPKVEYQEIWKFYDDRVNEYKDLNFLSDFDEDEEFEGVELN